ncbi:33a8d350-5139-446f-8693-bfcd99411a06 [Thermothielavioides terrestris]|uniref:33a8d350-5139-446f-8693-bfcd99411a06 n=1 Tax=Thermothielavioides terrestris TaxID=2587410 RepID=A0A3S4API9_9PEZI|nr:33a8d350-5139-446f-8693-bfcd99411a06 [Thermothielavioides terrestris]
MPLLSPTWAGQLQRPPDDSLAAPLLDTVSHTQTIQRLLKQNARIRDAWEAERKHLEANRERAEEVYKEERAIMEEERTEWEAERALLLAEIERLHQLVAALGGGTAPAKTPFCEGHPASDFLKPTDTEAGPVPVVDVQDIHPELEGIRIKASSVRKATFTDSASSNGSKTAGLAGSPPSASTVQRGRKEQTLQVLAAAEADRLTMHAGHTPSHSLSDLASVPSSGTGTQTSSNGTATPTMPHEVGTTDPAPAKASKEQPASQAANDPHPLLRPSDAHGQPTDDHPEPMFEPTHDPQLTGPLMVRNMPAHDEIFFQALTDKLEEVSKDDKAALPAVLKDLDSAQDAGEPEQ